MNLVPLTLAEARKFIAQHHRHNEPPSFHKFSIGLERDGNLVGVVIASKPIARNNDDGLTLELVRLTTDGKRNACSMLYGAACRAAFAMGYRRVITYTLVEEDGASLRAANFVPDGVTGGGDWARDSRPIRAAQRLRLFDPPKVPQGPKMRWVRRQD